jgi:hypothetical protein
MILTWKCSATVLTGTNIISAVLKLYGYNLGCAVLTFRNSSNRFLVTDSCADCSIIGPLANHTVYFDCCVTFVLVTFSSTFQCRFLSTAWQFTLKTGDEWLCTMCQLVILAVLWTIYLHCCADIWRPHVNQYWWLLTKTTLYYVITLDDCSQLTQMSSQTILFHLLDT